MKRYNIVLCLLYVPTADEKLKYEFLYSDIPDTNPFALHYLLFTLQLHARVQWLISLRMTPTHLPTMRWNANPGIRKKKSISPPIRKSLTSCRTVRVSLISFGSTGGSVYGPGTLAETQRLAYQYSQDQGSFLMARYITICNLRLRYLDFAHIF